MRKVSNLIRAKLLERELNEIGCFVLIVIPHQRCVAVAVDVAPAVTKILE